MDVDAIVFARLSLQRALLGCVSANFRAVVFTREANFLHIRFYIGGEISENEYELSSFVEAEVLADYCSDCEVLAECLRVDYPAPIDDSGVWVFQRQEPPI